MAKTTAKTTAIIHTIASVAMDLGRKDRLTREETLGLHTAYTIADDEGRKAMRFEWFVNYLSGSSTFSTTDVERILSGKLSKALNEDFGPGIYDRCSKQFNDHVMRDSRKADKPADSNDTGKPAGKAKPATSAEAAMVAALISVCGSRARALEVLNAAK